MVEGHTTWFNDEVILFNNPLGTTVWTGMDGKVIVKMTHSVTTCRSRSRSIEIELPNDVRIKLVNIMYRGHECAGDTTTAYNMHITMRQISNQDGQCGTFDLDASDDTPGQLKSRWCSGNVESTKVLIPY